ncbi:MAG TPA: response regulator [Candidatus Paceibacterota bacterium]
MKEKIIIALSDSNLSTLISNRLSLEKYITVVVNDGQEVLEKIKTEFPNLVIVDLILPNKSGYDILFEKSLDRIITRIPVIVVSNSGIPIEMRRLPATTSVKDYVIKAHIEPDEVLVKVNAILGNIQNISNSISKDTEKKQSGKKILWVEDDKFLSSILFKKFESYGYKVFGAKDGDEAFAILRKEIPDIILLDILLPGMNGFDILQKIKMNKETNTIPVIILSNMSKQSDMEKAKLLGANKFLVKVAVSPDEIIKEVENLVR